MNRSIRFKLSIILLVLFLFFITTLILSLLIFFKDNFQYNIVKEEQHYWNTASELVKKASNYNDEKSIENMLASYANVNMQIQLFDPDGNLLWTSADLSSVIYMSAKDYIVIDGIVKYSLQVNGTIVTRYELFKEYSAQYLWIILIMFAFLFFVIAFYLHMSITKPVLTLYKRMEADPLKQKTIKRNYRNDEIGVLGKRFDDMINRLQITDRQQKTMLAAISHDLKTPLTSIITYTERLASGKVLDKEKQQHYYNVVNQKADDIRRLIDKFQDAAQVIDLDERADYQIVSAEKFWRSILEPYTEEWDDVNAKLQFDCQIDSTVMIRADESSISRVIANIMENAIKYGGRPLTIIAFLTQTGAHIRLRIENNGLQVPDKELPLLFDQFYRVEPSRSREKGGSGLGLFICREIVEKHGGTIRAYKPWNNDFGIELTFPIVNY